MNKLLSCEYNMDTACVELKYADGSMIAIDTNAVEREFCDNMYQRSELTGSSTTSRWSTRGWCLRMIWRHT